MNSVKVELIFLYQISLYPSSLLDSKTRKKRAGQWPAPTLPKSSSGANSRRTRKSLFLRMPVEARDFVSLVGNQAGNAALAELAFKFLANPRIFVDVFDHV